MKSAKKALLLTVCALALVLTSVFGTLAYLTSTDSVTNTFTVGNVQITLDEAEVKADGTYVTDVTNRVEANEYKLLPGHSYIKDPTVHVAAGSENAWLFVKVENGIAEIEAETTIADQMVANGWTLIDAEKNVYAYKDIVEAGDDVTVFDTFAVKGTVGAEDLANYASAKIVVTAYAIQADGFETAEAAWTAGNWN